MPYTVCPECDEEFLVRGHPAVGDLVNCPECGAQLRVTSRNPFEVDLDEDDWYDDESDDDDYDDDDEE